MNVNHISAWTLCFTKKGKNFQPVSQPGFLKEWPEILLPEKLLKASYFVNFEIYCVLPL